MGKLLHYFVKGKFLFIALLFLFGVAQAQAPNEPTNLVVTPINAGGMIQFTAPSNIGGSAITNYEYSTDGGANWVTPSPAITQSPLIITSGLTNCSTYQVKLRAVNAAGSGTASVAASLTPTASANPGINWTSRTPASARAWTGVTYGNGLFVAVGQTGTGNRVMTSPDGINWTSRTSAQDDSWLSVAFGNGLFVAVADNGTKRVMTSTNGTDWTIRTAAAQQVWNSVTYGNGLFVAVSGDGSQSVMTSSNGSDWTLRNTPANGFRSITYGNGLFVAVKVNSVMTSPDGINWTLRTPAANLDWLSVGYGNGLFVATAGSGTGNRVMTSSDGINWTSRISAADNLWRSITYGDGFFVAIAGSGTGNRVMTSPDGVNWTYRTSASDNGWRSVTYGNGRFVAVSDNSNASVYQVMTSNYSVAADAPVISSATFGSSTTVYFSQSSAAFAPSITNYEYSTDNGSNWTAVSPAATTSPITISGLSTVPSQIRLRAVNSVGNSCPSNNYGCTNPTSGGTIAAAQSGTNPFTPAAFTSSAAASGESGTLEYKWQKSTTSNSAGFADIASSNSATYTAGSLTQTTWFKRLARVDCSADWISAAISNVLEVTVTYASAASSTPTLCINTALLPNITHSTTGATGISNDNVSGANGLPAGVKAQWAGNLITISGTPTESGIFNYSIPLTGGTGSVNATGTITVNATNTVGAASSAPTLCINTALTNITHSTTGATGIGTASNLPTGVTASWSANTITITGTPTVAGTYNYSIPLTGGCGSVNATGTITVNAAPVVAGVSQNGAFGNGLNLEGANDYVVLPNPISTAFTIEYWVKSSQTSPTGSQWYGGNGIVDAEYGGGTTDFGTALLNGKLAFGVGNSDVTIQSTTSINAGSWNHVAVSWNGTTGAMKLYINGTEEATTTGPTGTRAAVSRIVVGRLQTDNNNFDGSVDDLRIWNVVRTQSEIQAAKNSEMAGTETGLVAYYNFNQGTANGTNTGISTLTDRTSNGNNGTLYNFALTGSTSNWSDGAQSTGGSSSTLTVCANSTIQLSNATAGGVWSTSDANIATVDNTGLVTGVAEGSVTISYTVTNASNCSTSSTTTITVNALPSFLTQPSAAAQSVCSGAGSLNVEVDPGSGTVASYKWYSNASSSTSGGSLLVTNTTTSSTNSYSPTSTAYYYATITNSNGCVGTSTVSGLVTVTPAPSISSQPSSATQSICINGAPTNLSVTASAGSGEIATYKWYINTSNSNSGGTLISTTVGILTTNSYTPSTATAGTRYYYCVVTNSNGCSTTSTVSGAITVSSASVAGTAAASSTVISTGGTTTLSLSGYTGSIQWQQSADGSTGWSNVSGGSGPTSASYTTAALSATTYYKAVVTSGGCAAVSSNVITITVSGPSPISGVEVLVVGGGGGGGRADIGSGAGGGGGQVVSQSGLTVSSDITVTVGAGGAGGSAGTKVNGSIYPPNTISSKTPLSGTNGGQSSFGSNFAYGGGGGQLATAPWDAFEDQRGGNSYGSSTSTVYIGGSRSFGNLSGHWYYTGGGGAGSGGNGVSGNNNNSGANGGPGGTGVSSSLRTGSSSFYGGGGGGSGWAPSNSSLQKSQGTGGNGGGGNGVGGTSTGNNGTVNTGGGGGGSGSGTAGAGGSGIVVVRYAASSQMATGGTVTSYSSGGTTYQVHTFTSSGTFALAGSTPPVSLTSTGVAATVCTSIIAQTTTLAYSASTGNPTSYSIDWSAAAFTDQNSTSYTFVAGGGSISSIAIPAGLAAGTYTGTMTITNGSSSTTQAISLSVGSVSGTISGAGTVTSGTNSTTLTLSGYTGTIMWQSSSNNTSYSDLGVTSATYTATNLTATTFYRAIVTNGACTAATSSVATITVAAPSTAFGISGSTTANTMNNNVATVVDPNLVVTANGTVSGFTVTITGDYTDGDVLGYTGTLPSGVTAAAFNTTSRSINFTGTASAADWQTLLRTVTLTSTSNCYPTNRKVSFLPSNKYYNYFNGHYYEYVSTALSWTAAKSAAASRSFYGRKGYLVTISSEAENNYIWKLISQNSWIGLSAVHTEINSALGYNKFGSTTYGQFYWVTGPEKGTAVSNGLGGSLTPVSGVYNNWTSGEPNNYNRWGENSGHMFSTSGKWNDFRAEGANNGREPIPYIVEYGDSPGDDVSATISFTRDIIISGSPAGTISGADTVCNGTNSTTLTFSGGGTIQNWEYSTDNFATAGTPVSSTSSTLTATNLSSSRYYRAVVNTAGCSNLASSSALITVAISTAGSITALSGDVCGGGNAELTLNGNSGDIQKWQVSTSSGFTTGVTDISNTTNTLSHTLSSNGTYYFRAAVLNSACSGGTAVYTEGYPVTVTTGTPPVGGTVNSVAFCGGSNTGSLTLSGSTGTSYQWEVSTDGGVVYTNASSTSTTQSYTSISTTTKYRVLVTNGSCGSVYSSVGTITIGGTSGAQWTGGTSTDWGNTANWCGYIIGDDGLDVTISASAPNAPTLDRDRNIGNLNFNGSNKAITLGNYTLTATSFTNAAALNYVKTTGTGKLKVSISPGITTSLPVGNTAYNPVSITNNNSAADYFSVKVLDEVYANSVSGSLNNSGRVQRTWDITKTNANIGSGVDFVFNWNAGETSSFTTASLYNFSGGTWVGQTGTTSSASTSLTYRGFTGTMSSFAILSGFSWTGGGGNNLWNNPLNWSTGTLPLATTDIVISSGTPRLNIDYAVGGTLTLSGTGTLTIDAGKTLSISTGGVVDFGGKSVTIKSDVTGTGQLGRIQGTLSNATNVTVERYIPATGRRYRMLTPSVNTTTSIKANWMEGNMNTSGTNVNTVAGYGTQITGPGGNTNGFDVTGTNAASLYLTTNGVTPSYASIANTNGTLSALTGYFLFLRGDRSTNMNLFNTNVAPTPIPLPSSATTLRATGTVVQGTVNSFTNTLSSAAGGFSMVTNPYPAAIDWAAVFAASTNLNNYYSYWDPNLGFRGGFVTVTTTDGVTSSIVSLASKIIQSGQAFFVTTAVGGITPTISIQESHKVGPSLTANNIHGIFKANMTVDGIVSTKVKGISPVWENYQPNLQATTSTIPEFRMSLYYTEASGSKRLTDGAVALFDNQYTSALDGNDAVDAPNWDENIAITRNGKNLAIESRAQLNENDTLAISMSGMKAMNYELQFQGSNFGSTLLQPMLIDNYLKTLTPLSLNSPTTVPFTVSTDAATSSKDRFKVIFIPSSVLPFTVTKITATKKNERVQVDWEVKTDEELKSFDVERSSDGRNFVKLATVASLGKGIAVANYSWVDNNPMMGANYYRIKVIPQIGKEKVSPVAIVAMDKNKPSMEVYPNPTEGNDFNIKLSNLTKGIYQVIVTNATGQQVLVKSIDHPGGTKTQRMVFETDISKGVYRVQVQGEGLSLLSSIIKN